MQILIPMCGVGSRFSQVGYADPKPFIRFFNKAMIEHVIENLGPDNSYVIVTLESYCRDYKSVFDNMQDRGINLQLVAVPCLTDGPVDTCMRAFAAGALNCDEPLMIANCDQIFSWNQVKFEEMLSTAIDGSIFVFPKPSINAEAYSYAAIDHMGLVTATAEKLVISDLATTGIYVWKSAGIFADCARAMIDKNIRVNDEFYVAPVYNEGIAQGLKFNTWAVEQHWPIGTPEDLERWIEHVESNSTLT